MGILLEVLFGGMDGTPSGLGHGRCTICENGSVWQKDPESAQIVTDLCFMNILQP
jgi:hypothetical protein